MKCRRVITAVLVPSLVALLTAGQTPLRTRAGEGGRSAGPLAAPPVSMTEAAPDPLIQKLRANEVTVAALISGLSSSDATRRRQAAAAVVALRQHYIQSAQAVAERGYAGQVSPEGLWNALQTLAALRPSDQAILALAAEHIDFAWTPLATSESQMALAYAAASLLVRGSTAALPVLSPAIGLRPVPDELEKLVSDDKPLACALAIMGPALPEWLGQEAGGGRGNAATLRRAAQLLSADNSPRPVLQAYPHRTMFGSVNALQWGYDSADLEAIDPDKVSIRWDLADGLASIRPVARGGETLPEAAWAGRDMRRTIGLIAYGITMSLNVDPNIRTKQFHPFPPEAQTDAIRVLGCLRPTDDYGTTWDRLRRRSIKQPVEDDTSPDTAACLRALGQMDIPQARWMVMRTASEWSPRQQRAAAFVLGKMMGRYAIPLIEGELRYRRSLADAEKARKMKEAILVGIERLTAMLALGKEKKWFEGEFYGANDPHAYDLVFPDDKPAEAPAKDGAGK